MARLFILEFNQYLYKNSNESDLPLPWFDARFTESEMPFAAFSGISRALRANFPGTFNEVFDFPKNSRGKLPMKGGIQ